MRTLMNSRSLLTIAVAMLAMTACKKSGETADSSSETTPATTPVPLPPPPPSVISLFTGRHIGDNKQVVDTTSMFNVRDTMYVAITTDHTPNGGSMMAKWSYQTGQAVDSITQSVAKTDSTNTTAITEFHLAPAKPWPAGKYTVDILLDGKNISSKAVEVKK